MIKFITLLGHLKGLFRSSNDSIVAMASGLVHASNIDV